RWSDHGQEAADLERFEQALDLALASEEELGVLLVERFEPAIGADVVLLAWNRGAQVRLVPPDGPAERVEAVGLTDAVTQVNPGAHPQERRQQAGIERLGDARQQDRDQAEAVPVLGGAVLRQVELFARPVTLAVRPDEEGEGVRGLDAFGDLGLPLLAGREAPGV